jgi:hypothetical protein
MRRARLLTVATLPHEIVVGEAEAPPVVGVIRQVEISGDVPPADRPGLLAHELARVATAPVGHRNHQLWESTRNLYNLVATGALDHDHDHQRLLDAAERCGLLAEEPRQTQRTLASGRQVGLAHPGRPAQPTSPEQRNASPAHPPRAAGEPTRDRR